MWIICQRAFSFWNLWVWCGKHHGPWGSDCGGGCFRGRKLRRWWRWRCGQDLPQSVWWFVRAISSDSACCKIGASSCQGTCGPSAEGWTTLALVYKGRLFSGLPWDLHEEAQATCSTTSPCATRWWPSWFSAARLWSSNLLDRSSIVREDAFAGNGWRFFAKRPYSDNWSLEIWFTLGTPRAVIQMDSVLKTISLNSKTPLTVKKPQLRLPFGIKRPGATDKKSQKKRKAGNRKKRGKVEPAKRKSRQRQTESDNASTCSHDDSSSDSGDDDPTRALFEVEEPLPISDSAAQEEEKVVKILDAHGAICSAHESLVESMSSSDPASSSSTAAAASSVPSASVAEKNVCKPSSKTETHKPKTSSYFSKTLGVDEVGIAASARSMCFFCKNRIEKGTVRFSLHHNTKRPPAWVHSMCLPSLLCQEGSLMGPSKQRLEHLKNSGTLDHGLREAVSSALSAMPSG